RGLSAPSTGNDGAGGAGAGGRIIFTAATGTITGLTALVSGGVGGYANLFSPPAPAPGPACTGTSSHGPGGGGGGGAIFVSTAPAAASSVAGGASGLTNATSGTFTAPTTAYGATAGGNGFQTTGVTTLVGVQPCTVATRASVCGLRVDPSGLVEFATGSQRGTLGFDLFQTTDPTGRLGRRRLTDRSLTSPVPSSGSPILYRAETKQITAPYIVIEEIETSGTRRAIGPFAVGDERMRIGFERIEKWASENEATSRKGASLLSSRRLRLRMADGDRRTRLRRRRSDDEALKLQVAAAGPVRVVLNDLVSAGLPAAYVNRPDQLRLTNLGRPVPFRISLDPTGKRAIEFTAEELSTDYSGRNPYVLAWGRTVPPAPSVGFTVSGFPRAAGFVRIEQNVFNAAFVAQGADPWIWDLLVSGSPAGPYTFDLPGLRPAGGAVPVRVGVIGGSDHAHTVQAFINGQSAGTVTFKGKKAVMLEGTVRASALRASGNELSLTYTAAGASDDDPGLVFLDVLDLGVALAPPTTPVSIDEIVAYDSSLPAGAGADYLIVTHADFMDQARRIADLKEAEGHRTWVVDVENAYDRFSGGVMDPAAVQALIRQAVRAGAKYVLLVGDDTFDPRDFSGLGLTSYVPSLLGWDGQYGRVPSENRYADVDGDGLPDVAIGRLPVQTTDEADVMVDKISRQTEVMRAAGNRHLLVVDNEAPGDPAFTKEAQKVAAMLGSSAHDSWADVGQGIDRARTDLLNGLLSGPLATHYFGHGGEDFWADEHLLDADQAASLPADGHETLLFSWTCVSQNYLFGSGPSLSEALLLAPQAGALAAVGPTGITDASHQAVLFSRLYPYFLRGVPLGEALRRAKIDTLRLDPDSKPVVEGWSLLGDPALALPVEANRR
ncbi:MAG TPA: C25 family cysteine peptidase, partial [Vicinamibacteria bacterium]|nr:C25 family cysteine peptidase [Vicinamibacteria bacterium]